MRKTVALLFLLSLAQMKATSLPPAAPIVTEAELRVAIAEVPVAKIDLALPETDQVASNALVKQFFNQPEERRYSGLTNTDWLKKWQRFSEALVTKAGEQGLDAQSLEACLIALDHGQKRAVMHLMNTRLTVPAGTLKTGFDPFDQPTAERSQLILPGTLKTEFDTFDAWVQERTQLEEKDRVDHPERWGGNRTAVVPVAAYLARYAQGECWIIVGKWEMNVQGKPVRLGHIRVWALDAKTSALVAYATCM